MILHNVGSKIINVGTTILMPGDSMNITAEVAKLPAIEAFAEMGFVMVEGDKVAPVDAPAAEDTATPKRGRNKSASTAEPEQQ